MTITDKLAAVAELLGGIKLEEYPSWRVARLAAELVEAVKVPGEIPNPDAVTVLKNLNRDELTARLRANESERQALLVLSRAARRN